MGQLEETLGAILLVLVLLDIFFLVLYARASTGIYSERLSRFEWRALVGSARFLGRLKKFYLALSGPIILITVLLLWPILLSIAVALIVHPNLGTGITATHGPTPTDFITALYVGGSSLDFIGSSDFSPQTNFFKMFDLVTSIIGLSLVSLTVTYLMELYGNLHARNSLGLRVELFSSQTGDAAEVIAGLGPRGKFEVGNSDLADWAADTSQVRESHHFYPILFYFRFTEPYYSVSRTALVALDTVSLIRSALDDEEYGYLKEAVALEQLWRGNILQLRTLIKNLLPNANVEAPIDALTIDRWQKRYEAGVVRLKQAGIKTVPSGVEAYISLRTQWDRYITLLAPAFAYDMNEIDTALAKVK
ncbi:MAG: two pore domain potassium channel family protein [Bacteroidota bacterium]